MDGNTCVQMPLPPQQKARLRQGHNPQPAWGEWGGIENPKIDLTQNCHFVSLRISEPATDWWWYRMMVAMMVQLMELIPTSKRGHAIPPGLATWCARGPTRRWGRGRRSRGRTPPTQDLLTPGNRSDRQPVEFHIIEFVFLPWTAEYYKYFLSFPSPAHGKAWPLEGRC